MENSEQYLSYLSAFAVTYGLKLIGALAALIIGLWIISMLTRSLVRVMQNRNVDESLRGFFKTLFNITLKILLIISIASMVGIQTTSFIALLGAAGLALGMALSGTLQNFAGGVMILLFKPFKAGDLIEAQGYLGTVREIQIFNTILKTPDNKKVIVPNAKLTSDNIINYSATGTRRVELTIGVSYGDDLDKVRSVLQTIIDEDSRVLKDPASQIAVKELADSSVNFVFRVWVNTADYWNVFLETTEKVKKRFDAEGICIPFPQRDIHVYETK